MLRVGAGIPDSTAYSAVPGVRVIRRYRTYFPASTRTYAQNERRSSRTGKSVAFGDSGKRCWRGLCGVVRWFRPGGTAVHAARWPDPGVPPPVHKRKSKKSSIVCASPACAPCGWKRRYRKGPAVGRTRIARTLLIRNPKWRYPAERGAGIRIRLREKTLGSSVFGFRKCGKSE